MKFREFLSRLPPRTLLWQTFFLIALLIIVALAAWSNIYRFFAEVPRAENLAQMVISVVNLTRTALINADPERRQDLLIDLAALEGIRIYPAEASDRLTPLPASRKMHLLTWEIRRQLGDNTRFAGSWEGLKGFWVSFRLEKEDTDEYWIMLPQERLQRSSPLEWVGWASAALVLSLGGAYLIVSRVGRPLGDLAAAARQIGQGRKPERLAEKGPQEIAEVAHAFNQMAGDLDRLDADRALILAGVSHDLRTPLARLRLGIEMSGAPPQEVAAMVADIEEMDRIIGQFLDFGRDSSQDLLHPVDLVAIIQEICAPYLLRGTTIVLDLPAAASVEARELALRRALTNLMDNALRYAGDAAPLEIAVEQGEKTVTVVVADRGPGIPADEVERMKHPFTRLERARTNTKGAGLGLAIVDRIMQRCHGRLELLPRPGGGLRACLVFPRPAAPRGKQQAKINPLIGQTSSS
ncbi:MAG: HAMP domain-containing protein [Zoogloeaceae bacterium]|nr:HAMP domain-containing protein [Zoogloeaceae bacterium]